MGTRKQKLKFATFIRKEAFSRKTGLVRVIEKSFSKKCYSQKLSNHAGGMLYSMKIHRLTDIEISHEGIVAQRQPSKPTVPTVGRETST